MSDNPLVDPPPEIVQQGFDAIMKYFEDKKKGTKKLNQVKAILLGAGESGKTSLLKRVFNERHDPKEEQTDGIEIRKWSFKKNGDHVRVDFWDFGGQQIMHATHQFFLSERSLYILLLDGRRDEDPEHWLKMIESFGGDSPILVVLNKYDQNSGFDLDRNRLKEKYNGIVGFFRISCVTNVGIEEFLKALEFQLSQVPMIEIEWPLNWFNAKEKLENLKKDFISLEDFEHICDKSDISEDNRDTVKRYLHDLGVIIHFDGHHFSHTHVLDPLWATEGVYKIINYKPLADDFGVFDYKWLKNALKQKDEKEYFYPSERQPYIIDLMEKFELCYKIDEYNILVPDLLEKSTPIYVTEYDHNQDKIRFRLDYDFLPKSIIPRFIVRRHLEIKEDDGSYLRWRSGVVLNNGEFEAEAIVKVDYKEKQIQIFVTGRQSREYFAVILTTFREIHSSFKKFLVIENICMPDDLSLIYRYKDLIDDEAEGLIDFRPYDTRKRYLVKDVLGSIRPAFKSQEEVNKYLEILGTQIKEPGKLGTKILKEGRELVVDISAKAISNVIQQK